MGRSVASDDKAAKKGVVDGVPLFTRETFLFSASGFLAASLAFALSSLQVLQLEGEFGFALLSTTMAGIVVSIVNMTANDVLASAKGKIVLSIIVAMLCLGAMVGSFMGAPSLASCLIAFLGSLLLLSIWIGFLCCQTHGATNVMLMLVFILFGFAFSTSFSLGEGYRYLVIFVLCLVSLVLVLGSASLYGVRYEEYYRPAKESKRRYREGRNNFSKLVFDGIVLAVSLVFLEHACALLDMPSILIVGSVVAAAGLFTGFMRVGSNGQFERKMDRLILIVFAPCFMLMATGNALAGFVASAISLFFSALFTMTLMAAFADNTRALSISPHWNFGHEGCLYFVGMAIGGAFVTVALELNQTIALLASFAVLLVLVVVLHVDILRGGYPTVGADEDEAAFKAMNKQPMPLATWDMKAKSLADRSKLSPRQTDVFLLLVSGKGVKAISEELCISQATAKTHVYNIYRKMGVHSQSELLYLVEKAEVPAKE